jgi:tripartite-type tricarboxylate transporter receptor subunit TctC
VKLISLSPTPLLSLHKAGKVKIIAQAAVTRVASLPDVPTYRESGVDVEMGQWIAIFAPARTPREIVLRLNTEIQNALDAPAVRERYVSLALETVGGSPEQLGELIRRDYEKFGRLKKELQITVE